MTTVATHNHQQIVCTCTNVLVTAGIAVKHVNERLEEQRNSGIDKQSHWKHIYDKVENAFTIMRAVRSQAAGDAQKDVIYAVDELTDELKSGEPVDNAERLLNILAEGPMIPMSNYWQMLQTGLYAYPYIFVYIADSLEDYLDKDVGSCLSLIKTNVKVEKREVREAAAWALGSIGELLGNKVFKYLKQDIFVKSRVDLIVHELEGYMVAVGRICTASKDLSEENFNLSIEYLCEFTNCTIDSAHTPYIRVQAIKGIQRIVMSPHGRDLIHSKYGNTTWFDHVHGIVMMLLADKEVTVRKAAAFLFNELLNTLDSKQNASPGTNSVESNIDILLKEFAKAIVWEHRHGLNFSLNIICQDTYKISCLSNLSELFSILMSQIQLEHPDAGLIKAGMSNAEAGKAIVSIFLSYQKLSFENASRDGSNSSNLPSVDIAMQGQPKQAKSIQDFRQLYQHKVHSSMVYLCYSPFHHLQDSAGFVFDRLLKSGILTETNETDLIIHGYQNNHGHVAVSSANIRNWNRVLAKKNDVKVYISDIAYRLVSWLLQDNNAKHNNPEVREYYFKALSEFFKLLDANDYKTLSAIDKNILKELIYGCLNEKGNLSEFSQKAAFAALGNYIALLSPSTCNQDEIETIQNDLVATLIYGLQHDEEELVGNALGAVCKYMTCRLDTLCDYRDLIVPVMVWAYSKTSEVRTEAWCAISCLLGNVAETLSEDSNLILHILATFVDGEVAEYVICEESSEYSEAISNILIVLSKCIRKTIDNPSQVVSMDDQCEVVGFFTSVCVKVLVRHGGGEIVIKANVLAALFNLYASSNLPSFANQENGLLTEVVYRYILLGLSDQLECVDVDEMVDTIDGSIETLDFGDIDQTLLEDTTSIDIDSETTGFQGGLIFNVVLSFMLFDYMQKTNSDRDAIERISGLRRHVLGLVAEGIQKVPYGDLILTEIQNAIKQQGLVPDLLAIGLDSINQRDMLENVNISDGLKLSEVTPQTIDKEMSKIGKNFKSYEGNDGPMDFKDSLEHRLSGCMLLKKYSGFVVNGSVQPSLGCLNKISALVEHFKVDQDDEDLAYMLLLKNDALLPSSGVNELGYVLDYGVFSIDAISKHVDKAVDSVIDRLVKTISNMEIVEYLAVNLGLIKAENRIYITDDQIAKFTTVAKRVFKNESFNHQNECKVDYKHVKTMISILLRKALIAEDKNKTYSHSAYALTLHVLGDIVKNMNGYDTISVVQRWAMDILTVAKQQWHRKLRNAATVHCTVFLSELMLTFDVLLLDKVLFGQLLQLIIDALTVYELEDFRNPIFDMLQRVAHKLPHSSMLDFPIPTPLLTVKDNCTFVENRDN